MYLETLIKELQAKKLTEINQRHQKILARWDKVAKPLRSLGVLEDVVATIGSVNPSLDIKKRCALVLCADNGIVAQNVTQTGSEVTAIVAANMLHDKASINQFSKVAGVDVKPIDVGMLTEVQGICIRKIARGTKDFSKEPAMSFDDLQTIVRYGVEMVQDCKANGYQLIVTGEMGIGNTTTSSAITAVLRNRQVEEVTGPGAGLSQDGILHKVQVIKAAIEHLKPNPEDAFDVLQKLGGFDIAAMTGIFLGGALYEVPIMIDGFISSVAALIAKRVCPMCTYTMIASHQSKEPAAREILTELQLEPVICSRLSLGEGTGAVAMIPMIDMAIMEYRCMPTFGEIEIEEYQPL